MKHKCKKLHQTDWTKDDITYLWNEIASIAKGYGVTYYEPQFELVNEEYLTYVAYGGSHGLPTVYDHWSFGKHYLQGLKSKGTIMEMIINSNPCICYLLASNSVTTMANVMAHAAIGHSSVFKNNSALTEWCNVDSVLSYFDYIAKYIRECENKYGIVEVEEFLDVIHATSNISVDKYIHRQSKTRKQKEKDRMNRILSDDKAVNHLFDSLKQLHEKDECKYHLGVTYTFDYSDNFLRMLKEYGDLPEWKNTIIDIAMYINQYFYPQIQTKVLNEGYANFWSEVIMSDLYEKGIINNGHMLEDMHMNCMVEYQSSFSQFKRGKGFCDPVRNPYYQSINPYYLGHAIFKEIKRVCDEQDEESLSAVPCLRGKHWLDAVKDAMINYTDTSFIQQFLTPHLVRKLKLAFIEQQFDETDDKKEDPFLRVAYSHDDCDFDIIRRKLAEQYSPEAYTPSIKSCVLIASSKAERIVPKLYLVYTPYKGMDLEQTSFKQTLRHIERVWKAPVHFMKDESFNEDCMSVEIEFIKKE